ncbi:MAG: hypothetical protein HUN04_15555 [Desulfobacter sp.]|nr:MAG: hypothetical protein HUN04_15555 [Desulfobacter sp.]
MTWRQAGGTLLDETAVDIIREFDLKPGVSLDGDPPVQEALRGGAAKTFKGLARLEKYRVPFNVTTVVSSDNVDSLHRLVMVLEAISRGMWDAGDEMENRLKEEYLEIEGEIEGLNE